MEQRVGRPRTSSRRTRRVRWPRLIGLLVIVVILGLAAGLGFGAYRAEAEVRTLKTDIHTHDFAGAVSTVQQLGRTLGVIRTEAMFFDWLRLVPGVSGSYGDIMDMLTAGSADLQGIGGAFGPVVKAVEAPGSSAQKSARVEAAVAQAGLLMAHYKPQILAANQSVQNINPAWMPGILAKKGLPVGALKAASGTFVRMLPLMTGKHPLLATLLGIPNSQRYMVVFQNSGELRATGGFFTAFGYVPVSDGTIGKVSAQNIQNLLTKVTYQPQAPYIIAQYLPVAYWHIRDANSALPGPGTGVPDVPEAAQNINRFYSSIAGAPSINGMIFVDTWFADGLIGDVGGVNIPVGHGKVIHVTEQNANMVMEHIAEDSGLPTSQRKAFIATVMKTVLHDALHGSTSTLLKVVQTISQSLQREQLMLYFNNAKAEQFATERGWGGVIPQHVNGNFVEVIDENLLGHKDNYWMRESYAVNIRTVHGRNLETVTIHWVEPAIYINQPPYLVEPYQSWVTVFAPQGSQYVSETSSTSGGDGASGGINSLIQQANDPTVNKTEFGAHIVLPMRTAASQSPAEGTVTSTFWLPSGVNIHRVLVQKQPGIRTEPVTVTVNNVTRHLVLTNARQWLHF